jgi:hypothetical protein
MNKRHEDQIWSRLDELYANGTTFISWGELYHWYDLKRIAKTPYRDIQNRWASLLEERDEEYKDPDISEVRGGLAFFFSTKPEKLSTKAA